MSGPREVRTTLPDQSAAPSHEHTTHPSEITLSDGRVVRLRETTARDDEEVLKRLASAGYTMADLHPISLGRYSALFSIESINGDRFVPPKGRAAIEAFLNDFKSADAMRIIQKYTEVNGLNEALDATFPGEGGAATE